MLAQRLHNRFERVERSIARAVAALRGAVADMFDTVIPVHVLAWNPTPAVHQTTAFCTIKGYERRLQEPLP